MPPTDARRFHNLLEKTYESRLKKLEDLRDLIATAALVGFMLALFDFFMCLQLGEKIYARPNQPTQQIIQTPR